MSCARRLVLLLTFFFATALYAEPAGMITRVFQTPNDYGGEYTPGDPTLTPPGDPFSDRPPPAPAAVLPRKRARDILEQAGIPFPEGAMVRFNPNTGLLSITNTPENLELVEAYLNAIRAQGPITITYTLTVIEGPGELIRQANATAARSSNAAAELALLLEQAKTAGSKVQVVGDAFLETKSAYRASSEAVCQHSYASEFKMDSKSRASVTRDTHLIGLKLELEPTLGSDHRTLETTLSIELHPVPPIERQISLTEPVSGQMAEFPASDICGAHFTTSFASSNGTTKLVGITKPVGTSQEKEDILWAAFVTGTAHHAEPVPFSKAVTPAQVAEAPPGLMAAAFNVPEDLFESLMEKPGPLLPWFEAHGIVPVKDATATHEGGVLQVINTTDNIERIAALTQDCLRPDLNAKTVAFTLHTVQAPADLLRDLTHRAATSSSDQTEMWAAVEQAISRGEAKIIDSAFLETKPGTRATHAATCEHEYVSALGTSAKGQPSIAFEMHPVGSVFEIEPTVGNDGHDVHISYSYELHSSAPMARRGHFRNPGSKQAFEMPMEDFHYRKITTGSIMPRGSIKLLALNKPTGRNEPGMLWATFLKCDLVPQVAKARPDPASVGKPKPLLDPKAWNTRQYRVPPDFLSSSGPATPEPRPRITARYILEAVGIPFPEGATASYNPAASIMFVKNTNENLALVDAYVESITRTAPKNIVFITHILQGPGPLLRRLTAQAASKSDHRAELDELLAAVKAGSVQHLNTARIETRSGERATTRQGREHSAVFGVSVNEQGEPFFKQEMRNVGLKIELEAIVGADGILVELAPHIEFHTAEPLEHREEVIDTLGGKLERPLTDYFTSKVTTAITLPDGTARLLSLYKPTGNPEFEKQDILQAIFITCDILRPEK
ncbi:MAG: hypothetical protein ACYC67_10980 [Prosthecobacter sp.]